MLWGQVQAEKQAVEGNDPHKGREGDKLCFGVRVVSRGMVQTKLLFFSWLSPFLNPLMLELNTSAQHCMMRFFTGDFAS
jgi:hypothetical protein